MCTVRKGTLPYIMFRMELQIVRHSLACHLPGNTHQHSGDIVLTFIPIVQPSSNPSFSSSVCILSVMRSSQKDMQDSSCSDLASRSNYMYSSKLFRMLSCWIKHRPMHVQCLLVNGRLTPACCKYVWCSQWDVYCHWWDDSGCITVQSTASSDRIVVRLQ